MSKLKLTLIITIFVALIIGVLEYFHRQVDLQPTDVPPEYTQPYNVQVDTVFIEELKTRQGNGVGEDLGY